VANIHLEQAPDSNLTDMMMSHFNPEGLTKEELNKIFNDCLEIADDTYYLVTIAKTIKKAQYNSSLYMEVYKKAEKAIETIVDYTCLAGSLKKEIYAVEWALYLLDEAKKITDKNPCCYDYITFGDTYSDEFGDKNRGRELYKLAEQYATTADDYDILARSVIDYVHDTYWYAELKQKMRQLATEPEEVDFRLDKIK